MSLLEQEIRLYQRLLNCLEEEWRALISSQEDAILAMAASKEEILKALSQFHPVGSEPDLGGGANKLLHQLKAQVAAAQVRNHRLIAAALEVIQDFLGQLNSAPPNVYQCAGKVETVPGTSSFHRRA